MAVLNSSGSSISSASSSGGSSIVGTGRPQE